MQASISLNLARISFSLPEAVSYLNYKPHKGKGAMPDPNQPQEFDAVLGGQTPIPEGSAVLGGIEGVKRRLASQFEEQRIAALSEALKYGEAGLDLVIGSLQDESIEVGKTAYLLLRERVEPRVKQALKEYNPLRVTSCLHTLIGHDKSVNSVAISPDGKIIISGSDDKTIKFWNLHTGELIITFAVHIYSVNFVTLSLDGNIIISASPYNIQVWELQTGKLINTLVGCCFCAIGSDENIIVSGNYDKTIKVCNLRTGQLLRTLEGHLESVNCVAISPDSQTIVSGSYDNTIKVWNLHTGELQRTIQGHSSYVRSIAISPDGQTIVSGCGDNTIKVGNLHTGHLQRTLKGHSSFVRSVAISSDGQTIVSGCGDNTIKIWNLHTGELIRTLQGHSSAVNSVAISPDGQTIISGSYDNTIKIWGIR